MGQAGLVGYHRDFYPRPPRGGRPSCNRATYTRPYFYPRPPRGGRRGFVVVDGKICVFLSTPSARRATCPLPARPPKGRDFYPRPPRGGRLPRYRPPALRQDFYPRPPRGGRQQIFSYISAHWTISIHALREEGDRCVDRRCTPEFISIHALREEGDSKNREKTLCFCLIIHLSAQIAKRCL